MSDTKRMKDEDIHLIELVKTLWVSRKKMIIITSFFMFIGLLVALFTAEEYTASTVMFPQANGEKKIGGDLSSLASLAGMNLGGIGGDSDIHPTLYPQIINSLPFKKELLNTSLTINGYQEKIAIQRYFKESGKTSFLTYVIKYTIGLPKLIYQSIKGKGKGKGNYAISNQEILSISYDEFVFLRSLMKRIVLEVNEEDGYVTIETRMPEALASAELALRVQKLLQSYIIDFKIEKSKDQLAFIENRYFEEKKRFNTLSEKLANYRDANQNVNSALAKTMLDKLESEYELSFTVYEQLAKEFETQKIKVKEDTPVFTILKPVSVPSERSKPKRFLILMVYTILGAFVSVSVILGKSLLQGIKKRWDEV